MFYPRPEVDSVVVRLKPRESSLAIKDEAVFRQFIRSLFTQRNRKARGAVASYLEKVRKMPRENVRRLIDALPSDDRRVRQLSPEDFGELANVLFR